MKRILLAVSSVLFLCASLCLGGALTLHQVKKQGLSESVISYFDIKEPIREALKTIPGGLLLEEPVMKQADILQKDFLKHEEWTSFLDTVGMSFIHRTADETARLPDLDKQFRKLLTKELNTLFQNMKLKDHEQKLYLSLFFSRLSLHNYLIQLADETRAALSATEMIGIRMLYIGMQENIIWIIGASMLISFLMMLFSSSLYRGFRYASFILLFTVLLLLCSSYAVPSIVRLPYVQMEQLLKTALHRVQIGYLIAFNILIVSSVMLKKYTHN